MELFFTLIMVSVIFLAPVPGSVMTVTEASLASSFVVQHKLNLCLPVSSHVLLPPVLMKQTKKILYICT